MRLIRLATIVLVLLEGAPVAPRLAQAQFSASVTLVEIYATVSDASGLVTDLRAGDFSILDEGRPRPVETFANGQFPLSVALAIDRSFSMSGKRLAYVRDAAVQFLGALKDDDEATVLGIGSEVDELAPLSRDRSAQRQAVAQLTPWGSTRLHDAVIDAVTRIDSASGRRAIVVLTDGEDRGSLASAADVVERVRTSDVLCYSVVVGRRNSALFAQLAAFTGARAFWVRDLDELDESFLRIASELRHQYLVGFTPASEALSGQRRFRRVVLRTTARDARVRARPGYFAP